MRLITVFLSIVFLSCNNGTIQNGQFNIPDKGFLFERNIHPNDSAFPFYPVRRILSNFDSTYNAFYVSELLEAFNEPNISLRPGTNPVFRLLYNPWTDTACIVTITPTSIIAKTGDRVDYLHYEEKKLSEKELLHYNLFEFGFPVSKRLGKGSLQQRRSLDSLIKLYPELDSPEYYYNIMNKALLPLNKPYTYTTKTISLAEGNFQVIIDKLTKAGFWTLNVEEPCEAVATDGAKYFLEFCSDRKYVFMSFLSGCSNDKITNLQLAIREILKKYDLNRQFKI